MRNVYLSFLGTNRYLRCIYAHPDILDPRPTRYVQEATLRLYDSSRQHCSSEDVAYFFLTEEARHCNWEQGEDPENQEPCEGLESRVRTLGGTYEIRTIDIPKGENEEELWKIFDCVFGVIQEEDRITFDVTHAFRSIPMFALVILAYARALKRVHIEHVYYGAFETLGTLSQARAKPLEQRKAPIFDLTSFVYLLDWTVAVDRFLKAGDPSSIAALTQDKVLPRLRAARGEDLAARDLRDISQRLETFGASLSTCRSMRIGSVVRDLACRLDCVREADLVKPFKPLLDLLRKDLDRFDGEDVVRDGIQAAKWCLEHNLIQQGYTILQETVLTHFLHKAGKQGPYKRDIRETAGQAFKIAREKLEPKEWKPPACKYPELVTKMVEEICKHSGIQATMDKLSAKRNDLNHAGTTEDAEKSASQFGRELKALVDEVEKALFDKT